MSCSWVGLLLGWFIVLFVGWLVSLGDMDVWLVGLLIGWRFDCLMYDRLLG